MTVKRWTTVYWWLDLISTLVCVVFGVLFVGTIGHWASPLYLGVALVSLAVAVFSYLRWSAGRSK